MSRFEYISLEVTKDSLKRLAFHAETEARASTQAYREVKKMIQEERKNEKISYIIYMISLWEKILQSVNRNVSKRQKHSNTNTNNNNSKQ